MPTTGRSGWVEATQTYKDRQRHAITATALDLLTEHGGTGLSMSTLAEAAGISRPTLYRYYPDLDAVLVGIAQMVADHDDAFAARVRAEPDPTRQLHTALEAVANVAAHTRLPGAALEAALPPAGRDLLRAHQERVRGLLADILRRGVRDGEFAADVDPDADAGLILGLAAHAHPDHVNRVHHLVGKILHSEEPKTT
jgi:AcrR family transcriptional regulator